MFVFSLTSELSLTLDHIAFVGFRVTRYSVSQVGSLSFLWHLANDSVETSLFLANRRVLNDLADGEFEEHDLFPPGGIIRGRMVYRAIALHHRLFSLPDRRTLFTENMGTPDFSVINRSCGFYNDTRCGVEKVCSARVAGFRAIIGLCWCSQTVADRTITTARHASKRAGSMQIPDATGVGPDFSIFEPTRRSEDSKLTVCRARSQRHT
jgi:hypothetical protein